MFTGIIEELGTVQKIENKRNLVILTVKAAKIVKGAKLGDSIAVDGVCLTIVKKRGPLLTFEIMKESIDKSTLGLLALKQKVNLERALKVGSRFDGHFVTGHVDGLGMIHRQVKDGHYVKIIITAGKEILRYIVPKGSVCVDGVSLTVGDVDKNSFCVYLIPFTLKKTTFGQKTQSAKVNIETDILAKYILKK